jgi:hypothetical protein
MTASDAFSEYYAKLLQGTYDCVDRIVLNAFFPVGQTAGGIRTWWRFLRGDDLSLDDEHLREMAGTFSRRLQALRVKHGIPVIKAQARDRKHELAQPRLPNDPNFSGLFLVIKGNAPAPIWEVKCNGDGQIIEIRHRKSWPYVRHFYFQLIDREWGHVTIRICSYPPFGAQVILNGHETCGASSSPQEGHSGQGRQLLYRRQRFLRDQPAGGPVLKNPLIFTPPRKYRQTRGVPRAWQ